MDTSLEYRLMCLKANEIQQQWKPEDGDYMVSKASYCGDDDCNEDTPCSSCLKMSNLWVISGQYNYHESVGGSHWFFGGSACSKDGGNRANDTHCFIMTNTGHSEIGHRFNTVSKNKMLWLPRQDQLQSLFWNGLTNVHKIRRFTEWLQTATYNPYTESLESLWLKCYMEEVHHKEWNAISNIKKWEEIGE